MATKNNTAVAALPKWKIAFAVLGGLYLAGFLVWGVYAVATHEGEQGASELAANPERQDEILARRRAGEAQRVLGLSEEQTGKLAALIEDHTVKVRAARDQGTGDFEAQREKMMALRAELEQDLNALLTQEQRATFESLPMPDRGRIFGRGAFGGPPEGMRRGGPRPEGDAGPRGPRPEGAPDWGAGPRGPRPEGAPDWGAGPRGPRPEGGAGPRGPRPEGGAGPRGQGRRGGVDPVEQP